jgi:hypothetical protein
VTLLGGLKGRGLVAIQPVNAAVSQRGGQVWMQAGGKIGIPGFTARDLPGRDNPLCQWPKRQQRLPMHGCGIRPRYRIYSVVRNLCVAT